LPCSFVTMSDKAASSRKPSRHGLSYFFYRSNSIHWLINYQYGDAYARVHDIEQEVFAVNVVNVAFVVKTPIYRPCLHELEAVAAVYHHRLINIDELCALHLELVLLPKVGAELVIGNLLALFRASRVLMMVPIHLLSWTLIFLSLLHLRLWFAVAAFFL